MASKIAAKVLSGLGVAAFATLSLFSANAVSQTTGYDLTAKANNQSSAKQRLACETNSSGICTPTGTLGVRG